MEAKEIIEILGIDGVDSVDSFKAKFEEKFVSKAQAWEDEEIRSKVTGAITHKINQFAKKKLGISNDELKDKKWEEVLESGFEKFNSQIEELKMQTSSSSDTVVKELNDKLEKANKSIQEYKGQIDLTKQQAESLTGEWQNKFKQLKTDYILKDAKSKVLPKLKELNELESLAFEIKLKETFAIDFDENDSPIVLGKDGKRLANPNKIGEFLSVEDAIEKIAVDNKLLKVNNATQNTVNKILNIPNAPVVPTTPAANGKKVNQKALQHLESLKQIQK